jgi:hypothetical protein
MTLTIEIAPELEDRLEAEAESKGIGKDEFVRIVLEEKLNFQTTQRKRPAFESKIIATDLPVKDRSREYKWLKENRDEYDGKYVALDGDTLVAVSNSFKETATKAKELGIKDAWIIFVEGSDRPRFISGGLE